VAAGHGIVFFSFPWPGSRLGTGSRALGQAVKGTTVRWAGWSPLPEGLSPPARALAERLRALKDDNGLSLAELGSRTHYARASWERWLNGKRLITRPALTGLAEALGADPAPLLALLDQAMAVARDPEAGCAPPAAPMPSPAPAAPAAQVVPASPAPIAQLPADIADFAGRVSECHQLLEALSTVPGGPGRVPVAAVVGGGGLGKTTLAVHVAHRAARDFPDGQLYIDMRGVDPAARKPEDVLAFFLHAFGVPAGDLPADPDERAALFRTVLSGRRVLIVLDNARDPAQIRPLIPAAPGCAVLLTSRGKLSGLAGAFRLDLDLLPASDALRLLEHIVGADRIAREPAAVASILDSCSGLPLALRIAGARLADRRSWSLEWFATRLADQRRRVDELAVSDLAVRACFDLSHTYLLSQAAPPGHAHAADAARVFRIAALVPAAAFDADEVRALVGDPDVRMPDGADSDPSSGVADAEVADALEHLVNIHLITDHGDGRYAFHDLVQSYALRLLEESETKAERDRALRRLIGWYAAGVEAAAMEIDGAPRRLLRSQPEPGTPAAPRFPDKDAARVWCSRHVEALSGAIDAAGTCGRPDLAARIAVHAMSYVHAAMTVDWRDWLERALRGLHGSADRESEAWVRHRLGICHGMWLRPEDCVAELERALVLHRESGDVIGEMVALQNLTSGHALLGSEKALEYGRLALERFEEYGKHDQMWRHVPRVHIGMADCYLYLLRYESAVEHYRCAINLLPADDRNLAICLNNLGDAYRGLGRFEEAVASVENSLSVATAIRDRFLEGDGLHTLGRVFDHFGRSDRARESWRRSLAIFEELGFAPGIEQVRQSMAGLSEPATPR
jgi:tetratricopeptide (TPR) repeat protein